MAPSVPLSPVLRTYDAVLLDLDGCVWVGDEPKPGAAEAVGALREAGKGVAFLTNESRHSVEEVVRKLWKLGFQASVSEVVTVGAAVQHLLADRGGGSAFVVGSQALVDHVAHAGMRVVNNTPFAARADVVVVSSHDDLRYVELRVAVQAVLRGAELIGATRDPTFPMPDGPWPGSGAIVAAVETAAGRTADRIVGKPEPPMYQAALDRLGAERVLAIGDRLDTDVAGAQAMGLDAALISPGPVAEQDLAAVGTPPRFVAASLAELVLTRE
jgi:HAD superfamily hydrolase (TIGR01450 family)